MMQYDIFNNFEQFFGLKGHTGTTFYYMENSIQNSLLSEKKEQERVHCQYWVNYGQLFYTWEHEIILGTTFLF